jgi:hypothetical protein
MLSACFFGALNALGISMLGEYMVRTYDQARARPLYLVARTVNCESVAETNAALAPTRVDDEDRRLLSRSLQSAASTSAASGDAIYLELLDRVAELVELASARQMTETSPVTDDVSETTLY